MRTILERTVGHAGRDSGWFSKVRGLLRVLGLTLFLGLLHDPGQAFSATLPSLCTVVLAWDISPDPEVTGYRVYYGTASRTYTNSVEAGNALTNTVAGLVSGVTYFFAVTAYNASGLESDYSREVRYAPGLSPVRLHLATAGQVVLTLKGLSGQQYDILATQNLTDWTVIGTVTLDASGSVDFTDPSAASFPKRFYRTQPKP
jgi:hypothetical protein